jgi:NitT/TauT family transport system substrate-binding protein
MESRPRRFSVAALAPAVLVVILACTTAAPPVPAASSTRPADTPVANPAPETPRALKTVRLGIIGGISDAAFYIAMDRGYFARQGIEIEPTRFNSATQMVAPLSAGQLDVGGGSPSAGLYNATAREIVVKIVADKGHTLPGFGYEAVVLRKDLYDSGQVRSAKDLKGKRAAVPALGTTGEATLAQYVKTGGLTLSDLEVVVMGYPDTPQAFANGSIDAGLILEPFVTRIVADGSGMVLERKDKIQPGHQGAIVLYAPQFAATEAALARGFMVAYLQAARDYNDAFFKNDAEAKRQVVSILVRNTTVTDPALYDQMPMPGIDPNGRLDVASLDADQDFWIEAGYQQQKVNLVDVVDTSFATAAVAQLGEYR